jgi:hypothetical protein
MNTPRFSGSASKDNTSRLEATDYQAPAYAASIAITTRQGFAKTIVKVATLTGALTLTAGLGSATTDPQIGDELQILLAGDATGRTVTFSTGLTVSAATLVLAAGSKKGYISFMFDGATWVEQGRSTQA